MLHNYKKYITMMRESKLDYRGFMLDTGRKFFPVLSILALLNILHSHDFNKFHWHLYDAQNFPLQFQFQSQSNSTTIQGEQFYTKYEIQYIVQYAHQRGIDIVPQFEMPGHCDVLGELYKGKTGKGIVCGEFDRRKPIGEFNLKCAETYEVLGQFLNTFLVYFPNEHAHFGGDQIAGIWPDSKHNQTLAQFYNSFILGRVCTVNKKHPIIWEDCLTQKDLPISHNFTIQAYKPLSTLTTLSRPPTSNLHHILDSQYRTIVSTAQTWYVGNATIQKIKQYQFPQSQFVVGGELVWFTSENDNAEDKFEWMEELIEQAGIKFMDYNYKMVNS